jgi:DNA invertase Pin-like site-specific DNA recombinase
LVRRKGGGEMLVLFHSRAKSVDVDDQAERYTDRLFDQLFGVLAAIRLDLSAVFDGVAEPFATETKKRNPSISVGVRERVIELRKEGKQYKEIAKAVGICVDSVRRILREAGMVRKYELRHR